MTLNGKIFFGNFVLLKSFKNVPKFCLVFFNVQCFNIFNIDLATFIEVKFLTKPCIYVWFLAVLTELN